MGSSAWCLDALMGAHDLWTTFFYLHCWFLLIVCARSLLIGNTHLAEEIWSLTTYFYDPRISGCYRLRHHLSSAEMDMCR